MAFLFPKWNKQNKVFVETLYDPFFRHGICNPFKKRHHSLLRPMDLYDCENASNGQQKSISPIEYNKMII